MSTRKSTAAALVWCAVAALLLAACGGPAGSQETGGVQVKEGRVFEVSLEANPTTGYLWEVRDIDEQVLQLVREEFLSDSSAIGAGGTSVFSFKAVGRGQTTLTLVYRRPWEKDVEPIEVHTVEVSVR